MTGPPSSSYPGQVPPPAAVMSPENEEKSSGFDRNSPASFSVVRPPIPASERRQLDLRIGFRPNFGMRFRPLPVSFWGTSKNKSDSKLGVLPRVGVLSRDLWFFRRWVIALDTHALPARGRRVGIVVEGHFCPIVILSMSRARRCARISFWIPLEFRTDIAYRVFSGFARFGPLDGPEVIIC
ncbi:unnamed protein product [Prunus armeniaca]